MIRDEIDALWRLNVESSKAHTSKAYKYKQSLSSFEKIQQEGFPEKKSEVTWKNKNGESVNQLCTYMSIAAKLEEISGNTVWPHLRSDLPALQARICL